MILFLWQMPHFLAIAWRCREDYARAGFRMLPIIDPTGASTGRQALIYAAALLPISLWPTLVQMSGLVYFGCALLFSAVYLVAAWQFFRQQSDRTARRLFFCSIIYLPMLLLAMTLDSKY
jgi:heme o synthase